MMRGRTRMVWHRTVQQWHWMSAALCLAALLLFSISGFTLNHADDIRATPRVRTERQRLPESIHQALIAHSRGETADSRIPESLARWLSEQWGFKSSRAVVEWSEDEIYLSAPGPGRDAWVSIDPVTGNAQFESTWRGPVAWLNDLHKGRNTGGFWQAFMDLVVLACVVFSVSGLFLLQLQARQRRGTWPAVGAGAALLLVMMLFFVH